MRYFYYAYIKYLDDILCSFINLSSSVIINNVRHNNMIELDHISQYNKS